MIRFVENTPINRVILAINHYVSTGDHLGHGSTSVIGEYVRFFVPVNQDLPVDLENWDKFASKLREIETPLFQLQDHGAFPPHFIAYSVTLKEEDLSLFADVLIEKPGVLGWGGPKSVIDNLEIKM